MIELRPCPFCGKNDIYIDEFEGEITIGCPDCGVHAHAMETREQAISLWNLRRENEELRAKLALAEKVIAAFEDWKEFDWDGRDTQEILDNWSETSLEDITVKADRLRDAATDALKQYREGK